MMLDFIFITIIFPISVCLGIISRLEMMFGLEGDLVPDFIFQNLYIMMSIGIGLWLVFFYVFYKFFIKKLAKIIEKKLLK